MQKLFKVPVIFLFIASCLGLFLRYIMISPVDGVNFSYLLHSHSHVMFLGWVFNVLFLAFVTQFTDEIGFRGVFWMLQLLVVGMLVSFPLQGYGLYSIVFTTLHTLVAFVFVFLFFRSTSGSSLLSVWLARVSLLMFVISSIGPFYLGYLMSAGMSHSDLYRFSIYFYLHFQYNGFFFFGVLSLFMRVIESGVSAADRRKLRLGMKVFLIACFPAYCLSLLWAKPGLVFNLVGLCAAIAQLSAMVIVLGPVLKFWKDFKTKVNTVVRLLWQLACLALICKLVLQLASADPRVAIFANEYRTVVIAYLHVVLVGVVTLFLLGWLLYQGILTNRITWSVRIFLAGFIVTEILLASFPWLASIQNAAYKVNVIIFLASIPMVGGAFVFLVACYNADRLDPQ